MHKTMKEKKTTEKDCRPKYCLVHRLHLLFVYEGSDQPARAAYTVPHSVAVSRSHSSHKTIEQLPILLHGVDILASSSLKNHTALCSRTKRGTRKTSS